MTDNQVQQDIEMSQLVQDGIIFLSSITKYYGPTQGMEVWNAMGDAMGKTLKGKIFMAMLCGENGGIVNIDAGTAYHLGNAVAVIKCIRKYTQCGLKEAKDQWDMSKTQIVSITLSDANLAKDFRKELRDFGCIVH